MLTPALLACYAMSGVIHLASISLNTLLPFHVVALGGSRAERRRREHADDRRRNRHDPPHSLSMSLSGMPV